MRAKGINLRIRTDQGVLKSVHLGASRIQQCLNLGPTITLTIALILEALGVGVGFSKSLRKCRNFSAGGSKKIFKVPDVVPRETIPNGAFIGQLIELGLENGTRLL